MAKGADVNDGIRQGGTQDDTSRNCTERRYRVERNELIKRLLADKCEMCGSTEDVQVHHVRALRDLNVKGQRAKSLWVLVMAARKRKTLVVCRTCHLTVHGGDWQPRKQQ